MLIDYENVNVYQEENKILENVNFHVDEGEFIYIIGKVGSGKSSLLKTFYCELDLTNEEENTKTEVLGRDVMTIRRKDIPSLRREMGIIFQDFQLLHDRSVRKNLRFVLRATGWEDPEEISQRIEDVLTEVGMLDKIDRMPHELSGGEQQRIAIARALLNHPKIIIADEPTGNLDPETAFNIVKLLKDVTSTGTAVVMTTHNIPLLDQFPGIVYRCRNGQISDVTKEYNHLDLTEDAGGVLPNMVNDAAKVKATASVKPENTAKITEKKKVSVVRKVVATTKLEEKKDVADAPKTDNTAKIDETSKVVETAKVSKVTKVITEEDDEETPKTKVTAEKEVAEEPKTTIVIAEENDEDKQKTTETPKVTEETEPVETAEASETTNAIAKKETVEVPKKTAKAKATDKKHKSEATKTSNDKSSDIIETTIDFTVED